MQHSLRVANCTLPDRAGTHRLLVARLVRDQKPRLFAWIAPSEVVLQLWRRYLEEDFVTTHDAFFLLVPSVF